MILLLNNQPITLENKVALLSQRVATLLGSDSESNSETPWLGDGLTVNALFPRWIVQAYNDDPTNISVVPIIKNYNRWLLSLDYGYGAQLEWENLRSPLYVNTLFLEALADFYFNGANFNTAPLSSILPNIRRFLINADLNYFNNKGTPESIKYLIVSLLGFDPEDIIVSSSSYCTIQIRVASAEQQNFEAFKPFLQTYAIPAGMIVNYMTL